MIPWKLLGEAQTPGNGALLRLYQHDTEFSMKADNDELMNSRVHGSEDALATLACQKITNQSKARVLIGGLGMGYTLRSALDELGAHAEVDVAEIVPEVADWNREFLGHLAGSPLDDGRVRIREGDVVQMIKTARHDYNAILLDVDNGPQALTSGKNNWLYSISGLETAAAALRPKGVLAIWASGPDAGFAKRLGQAGFDVDEVKVRGRAVGKGAHHIVWVAQRI